MLAGYHVRRAQKHKQPPGTLHHVGKKRLSRMRIDVIDYSKDHYEEEEGIECESCFGFKEKPTVSWIKVEGIHDIKRIEKIGIHFNIHPLVLEDITNSTHRAKWEEFPDYIFIVIKMVLFNKKTNRIDTDQISFVLGTNYLISFEEKADDIFDHVKERIKANKGRIRRMGVDYLAYRILDAIVDNYFIILDRYGMLIERYEDELMDNPTYKTMQNIHNLKKELHHLQMSISPLREVIGSLRTCKSDIIHEDTKPFIRDLHDHTIMVTEAIESYRTTVFDMANMYQTTISNRMNEVMKTLTIIATIFIPLGFLASVYGMNLDNIPEIAHPLFYPYLWWLFVLLIIISMFIYFRSKRWL